MKYTILLIAFVGVSAVYAGEEKAQIISQEADISPEGHYQYAYETDNGIVVKQQGAQKANGADTSTVVQGTFAYKAPGGEDISLRYTADEDGFHPEGKHLPVAPAIPELIIRALKYLADHPPKE